MSLKRFVYHIGAVTPGAEYDSRENVHIFMTISEPEFSVGIYQRESSFVLNVTTFDEKGEEMKVFFSGMMSAIENGQTVFLSLGDSSPRGINRYQSAFFEFVWNYLENCAKSLFPNAEHFGVLAETGKDNTDTWNQFCLKYGYKLDSGDDFFRKPAEPYKDITLPKPFLAEKTPDFAGIN